MAVQKVSIYGFLMNKNFEHFTITDKKTKKKQSDRLKQGVDIQILYRKDIYDSPCIIDKIDN